MLALPYDTISQQLGELFTGTQVGEYLRVRTPYLYPDGDVIDIFCQQQDDVITLTDLGETLGWLNMQTVSQKRSPKQQRLIDDVCLTYGIELYQGMLMSRVKPVDNLAYALNHLAQAALRVSDVWFTFRNSTYESIKEEVAEFLDEYHIPFQIEEKLAGRSGLNWKIDFHTRTPKKSALIYVLSTGSRSSVQSLVNQTVSAWHDLSHLKISHHHALEFVTLFDDTLDIWKEEHFHLVESLSTLIRWSTPENLVDILKEAV
jgi:hypothetical protein